MLPYCRQFQSLYTHVTVLQTVPVPVQTCYRIADSSSPCTDMLPYCGQFQSLYRHVTVLQTVPVPEQTYYHTADCSSPCTNMLPYCRQFQSLNKHITVLQTVQVPAQTCNSSSFPYEFNLYEIFAFHPSYSFIIYQITLCCQTQNLESIFVNN